MVRGCVFTPDKDFSPHLTLTSPATPTHQHMCCRLEDNLVELVPLPCILWVPGIDLRS